MISGVTENMEWPMKPQNNHGSDLLEKCDPDLGGDLRESPEDFG